MAEFISCPACQRRLEVPETFLGQTVQCPECHRVFVAETFRSSVQTEPPPVVRPAMASDRIDRPRRRDEEDDDYDDDDIVDTRRLRRSGVPHRGGMILALGIIALIIFPYATPFCGPLAWYMGNTDLAEIRAGRMDSDGNGMVQAGRILGMVSTLLAAGIIAVMCIFVGLMIAAGGG